MHLLIKIEERNGEHEYDSDYLLNVTSKSDYAGLTADQVAEKVASSWYGEDDVEQNEDSWYEFDGGCIWVRVKSYQEVPEADYNVLRKYI